MSDDDFPGGEESPPPIVLLISLRDVVEQHVIAHAATFCQTATDEFIRSCSPPIEMADLKKVPVNQQRLSKQIEVSKSAYVVSRMALLDVMMDEQPQLNMATKKATNFAGVMECPYSRLLHQSMILSALEECKGDESKATEMVVQGLKVMGYDVETRMIDSDQPGKKICVIVSGCSTRSQAYKNCNQTDVAGALAAAERKYER